MRGRIERVVFAAGDERRRRRLRADQDRAEADGFAKATRVEEELRQAAEARLAEVEAQAAAMRPLLARCPELFAMSDDGFEARIEAALAPAAGRKVAAVVEAARAHVAAMVESDFRPENATEEAMFKAVADLDGAEGA
mgnify:CR=1 FL=1